MVAEWVTSKRGYQACMPEVLQEWGQPMIPPVGAGVGSFQAVPVLPVYTTTWKEPGWGEGGVRVPRGLYELTWAASKSGVLESQVHPERGWEGGQQCCTET